MKDNTQENTKIKAMSFSSAVRTRHVFAWFSIFWFTSVVNIAVSLDVELQTLTQVAAQCGDKVTLTCDASSSRQLDIMLFSWVARNKTLCEYERDKTDHEFQCESKSDTSYRSLTLTLINVMPVNEGKYLCKLRCNLGVRFSITAVTVQECLGSNTASVNGPNAECSFNGVYPSGTVHWFQGDDNLTDSTSTQQMEAQHGLYNISSMINVKEGNLSQPYDCLLWIPSLEKYLSHQQIPMSKELSSGSVNKLQWICVVVEILMVIFLM